jgi:hypothetical protein
LLELQQIIGALREHEHSSLSLEIAAPHEDGASIHWPHPHVLMPPQLDNAAKLSIYYFRRFLRLHTEKQREATNLFIQAMRSASTDTKSVNQILLSERIHPHKSITAKQALHAYQKFELLEQSGFQYFDDPLPVHHRELRFMHAFILKIKTYFL